MKLPEFVSQAVCLHVHASISYSKMSCSACVGHISPEICQYYLLVAHTGESVIVFHLYVQLLALPCTPESAIECPHAGFTHIIATGIHSMTEHYVRPGNEAIVTTLASFPDLHMFVTCSLKSCANSVLQAMNAQSLDQPSPYQMLYRQMQYILKQKQYNFTNMLKAYLIKFNMHLHDNLSLACSCTVMYFRNTPSHTPAHILHVY